MVLPLKMRENPTIWWNPSGLWSVLPTPSVHPRFHDEGKFEAWTSHPARIHIPARGHLSPDHRGTAVKPRGESISLKPAHPNPQNIQQGQMFPFVLNLQAYALLIDPVLRHLFQIASHVFKGLNEMVQRHK